MAEYIDRNELIENLKKFAPEYYNALINQLITKQPTADAIEVNHGEWLYKSSYYETDECNCSLCGQRMTTATGVRMNYCPNCGAKMDKGGDTDAN